jgi:G3E family GTPase
MNDPSAAADTLRMITGVLQTGRMISNTARGRTRALPFVAICGFLGAGKTTLLTRLLSEPHGRRIAVLVNDFGAINIDAELIRARSADTIDLTNGCACCSIADELVQRLSEITNRPELPDVIVLEASGLADPRGVIQIALANPVLRLEGVIAVVDGEALLDQAADPACRSLLLAQLSSADLILLNKTDLIDPTQQETARHWLGREVPGARVLACVRGEVPVEILLGIETRGPDICPLARPDAAGEFESWSLSLDGQLARPGFEAFMDEISGDLLRAKGLLRMADDPSHITLYQRTARRWSYSRHAPSDGAAPPSRLVLIGRAGALEAVALAKRFRDCLT